MNPIEQDAPRDPLRFMADEHLRLRLVCNTLEAFARQADWDSSPAELGGLRAFLANDVAMAVADQEEALFPMLAARSGDTLSTESTLELLREDHRRLETLVRPVLAALDRMVEDDAAPDSEGFRRDLAAYVAAQRHHMIWEERILWALAEECLNAGDKARLRRAIKQRRSRK